MREEHKKRNFINKNGFRIFDEDGKVEKNTQNKENKKADDAFILGDGFKSGIHANN